MKKLLIILGCVCFVSCASIRESATSQEPNNRITTATSAELQVSPTRISFTYEPSVEVRRGGDENVIKTAVREALRNNGDGDVLVGMEYITLHSSVSIIKSSIIQITVTGYPATYKNFHSLGD